MRSRLATWLSVLGCLAVLACGSDYGPPRATPPTKIQLDGRYVVEGVPYWNLVGNALTPGHDALDLVVTAAPNAEVVDVWVAGGPGQRLVEDPATGRFTGRLDISAVPAGEHDILIAANGSDTASSHVVFSRTHPYYVLLSTDWDFAEPGQVSLDYHDQLRAEHPDIKFTHFIGPYTFTAPTVTEERKAELAAWAIARRDQHGDELGLHIHPYCHFVETAGVTCNTTDSTVYASDTSGYTIRLDAYSQAEFEALLTRADQIFVERGLGKPVTFRAGGWTAGLHTLKALAARGYVADTSANNWARMEKWQGQGTLYTWNMTNWSTIGDTSQPYYPNVDDKQSGAPPHVPILQVPDNAIMVDYVTRAEMVEIFGLNWPGPALPEPRTFMMGFHPSPSMTMDEYRRLDGILDHADQYLASNRAGPVVYAVLEDMPTVWPLP